MSHLILYNAIIDEHPSVHCNSYDCDGYNAYELSVEHFDRRIDLNTLLDEMKLEAFLEGMNNKSLEQIQEFFKK